MDEIRASPVLATSPTIRVGSGSGRFECELERVGRFGASDDELPAIALQKHRARLIAGATEARPVETGPELTAAVHDPHALILHDEREVVARDLPRFPVAQIDVIMHLSLIHI